ncbi:NPC intracellular cholesterol transporter 2 homolog a-like [Pollicipes pollicipes]|nr:NPC intracellular cholesterol transporter 2 homolog a-like [Pollicipes pollicipes]XP_037093159.1 NPC intracellular cholesterol transporter 2 homolog a-like [Pollicipes pollicipes]
MKSMIFGLLDNIPIPLDYDNQMCSQMLAGRCPAKAGQELTYAVDLPVAADMPAVGITLEWHITDQHDATVLCALVPAQFT